MIPNKKYPLSNNKQPQPAAVLQLFQAQLRELGVRSIDLRSIFLEHGDIDTLYFPTDSHINAQGARLTAHAIERILQRELVH